MNNKKIKIIVFIGFLLILFGGAWFMYNGFLKGRTKVNPNEIAPRTEQNINYVDSLKRAGYYGEEYIPKK